MKISSPLAAALMLASLVGFQAQAGTRQVLDANGQTRHCPRCSPAGRGAERA